ncbi:RagB/SusD family nutrient uptake outer membrane protein [Spirosoma daeguense]
MKNSIYLLLLLTVTCCTPLDLNPLSEGSSETWYSNETEVDMAVSYLFAGGRFYNYEFFQNAYTDRHSDDWTRRLEVTELSGGTITGQSSVVIETWERAYSCIAAANRLLLNIQKSAGSMTAEKLNRYAANARFARATKYAELIFLFGDVPYYNEILTIDEAFKMGRTSSKEILKTIYEDYEFGVKNLPTSYGNTENKYATKGAALVMKARIALYMHDYAVARDAAKACMDLGVYALLKNYSDIYTAPNSSESIFNFPRSVTLSTQLPGGGHLRDIVSRTAGGNSSHNPSLDLLLAYLCTDGLTIDKSPLFDPRKPFKNRDPRLSETIVPFGTRWLDFQFEPHPDTLTVLNYGTGLRVSNLDNRAVQQFSSYNALVWKKKAKKEWLSVGGDHDNIIARFADVLLMYAEAKIELNEIDKSVLDAMNQVRARAYGATLTETAKYPVISETSQVALRKLLRIERRMEFAFEGFRYPDLIRWKLAEKALNRPIYGTLDIAELRERVVKKGLWFFGETPKIDQDGLPDMKALFDKGLIKQLVPRRFDASRQYLWPIPSSEIIINPNIKQNPGY